VAMANRAEDELRLVEERVANDARARPSGAAHRRRAVAVMGATCLAQEMGASGAPIGMDDIVACAVESAKFPDRLRPTVLRAAAYRQRQCEEYQAGAETNARQVSG